MPDSRTPSRSVPPPQEADGTPLFEVRDLTRSFEQPRTSLLHRAPRVPALRGLSFDVHAGERFGIVGESGSGKSTLLRLLGALDQPTSGSIRFRGEEIAGRTERRLRFLRRDVQMVFQDPMASLDPRMRVRDIVREPLIAQKRDLDPGQLTELLESVGLSREAADRFPHQFSGGQRQRIAIARALSVEPTVLLADEPVSALDVSVRAQILNLLAELVERFALTLVFVSHDLSVVRHVCDTITVMRGGEIVESGTAERISVAPQHPYTERLIASIPTLRRALAGVGVSELASGHLGEPSPKEEKP
jgi:peptide/nickel transport system ATP-binding protein